MSFLLYVLNVYKGAECQANAISLEFGADSRRLGAQNGSRNGLHLDDRHSIHASLLPLDGPVMQTSLKPKSCAAPGFVQLT